MCLYVCSKLLTAKNDIEVYKVLTSHNKSAVKRFQYKRGIVYPYIGLEPVETFRSSIHAGYHSFKTKDRAELNRSFWHHECRVVKFIIPKGSKYYLGTNGDIVSTRIKFPKWR